MRRIFFTVALFACACASFGAPSSAFAGVLTVNDLQNSCQIWLRDKDSLLESSVDAFNSGRCSGYVLSALDTADLYQSGLSDLLNTKRLFCPPNGMRVEQAVKVFLKWSADHPEQLNGLAADGVIVSEMQAFPCK